MKPIDNVVTSIKESQVKYQGDPKKIVDYKDLISLALDIIPQGGFTPKDIRDRNRIQSVLDKSTKTKPLSFEDSDHENLKQIITKSRWSSRHKDLDKFLSIFNNGSD